MAKVYDRSYFEKWYRDPRHCMLQRAALRRKVAVAVAVTEHLNGRPLGSVLDVGCGEGLWSTHLKALRPGVPYLGLDSSAYAVRRFGKSRNIRPGSFGQLGRVNVLPAYDLVVCSDVLHYVEEPELVSGLAGLARVLTGVVYLGVLTAEDQPEGDLEGFHPRSAAWYRKRFRDAGLFACGMSCYVGEALVAAPTALELA
jgi:2-polyprenyl-3-methyl-5-hydroxy-6-metoxy-1,4-benzoquinol methylase